MTIKINDNQAVLLKDIFADGKLTEDERKKAKNDSISDELITELSGKKPDEVNEYVDKLLSNSKEIPAKKSWILGGAAAGGILNGLKQGIKHGLKFGLWGAVIGAGVGALIGWGISKFLVNKKQADEQPEENLSVSKMKITDSTTYALQAGDNMAKVASKYNVSLTRMRKMNPVKDENRMQIGHVLTIPKRYHIDGVTVATNFDDVSACTGLSKNYINDICSGIECGSNGLQKKHLKAEYDNVPDEGHPKGHLTIGFGHTGWVNGKKLTESTTITKEKAYELLAKDLLNARAEAITFMGEEEFLRAPQSIQDAIVDIAFNKDSERVYDGIIRDDSGKIQNEKYSGDTTKLKEDLKRNDYVSAAQHVIYDTPNAGLRKRNVYRVIVATRDLSPAERQKVLDAVQSYYEKTKALLSNSEGRVLKRAWKNARNGICIDFFD